MGVMTVVGTVRWPKGLWVRNDGYEYPLVVVVVSAALTLTGPRPVVPRPRVGPTDRPVWGAVAAIVPGARQRAADPPVLHRRPPAPETRTHAQAAERRGPHTRAAPW